MCLLRLASRSVNTIVEQLQEALTGVGFGSFAAIGITACLSVLWLGDTRESYNAFSFFHKRRGDLVQSIKMDTIL